MRKSIFTIALKIAVICLGEKGFLVLSWLPFLTRVMILFDK